MPVHGPKPLLCLTLALLGLACAAPRPVPSADRLTRGDLKYQAVVVVPFTIAKGGVKEPEPGPHLAKAQESCVALLVKSGLFDSVVEGDPGDATVPTLVVRTQLTALRYVGSGKQQWLGGLAGRSEMKVRVVLADPQSGKAIANTEIVQDQETAGGPWTFGATDRSLPAEVGGRIAEFVAVGASK